ncbi:hypothetical protein BZA77DRAFT_386067 [Pyronema omphalodes]|nr:hypothetical protein BZA77DRAFT_386067 [Pyronema omphalodes]
MIPRKTLLAQVFRRAPARRYYSPRNPPEPVHLKIDRNRFTTSVNEFSRLKQQNAVTNTSSLLRRCLLDSLVPPPATPPYLSPSFDQLGNLFIPLPCTRPSFPTILLGIETFHSFFPTLSALEIARSLSIHPLHHPLILTLWTGSDTRPNLGSATWAGEVPVEKAWAVQERSGRTVKEILEDGAWRGERLCSLRAGPCVGAYFQMVGNVERNWDLNRKENWDFLDSYSDSSRGNIPGTAGVKPQLKVAAGIEAYRYIEVTFKQVDQKPDKLRSYTVNLPHKNQVITRMLTGAEFIAAEFGARITSENIGEEEGFLLTLWHPTAVENIAEEIEAEWKRPDVDWSRIRSVKRIMNEPSLTFGGDAKEVLVEEVADAMGVWNCDGLRELEMVLRTPVDAAATAKLGIPTGVLVVGEGENEGERERNWLRATQTMLNAILEWDSRHSVIERIPERSFLE